MPTSTEQTATIDAAALASVINQCFDLSRLTYTFSDEQCKHFLYEGKRLRGLLVNLISARFGQELTPEVVAANTKLAGVAKDLEKVKQELEHYAATVKSLTDIVGALEGLLKAAPLFL